MLPFSTNLTYLVAALAGGRLLAALVHLMLCFRIVPGLIEGFRFESNYIKPLLTFGGWITVGNLVWPLMVYMDRFVVAGTLSATAMAYYATPFEIIMKLEIVPVAIMGVMFPAFGSTFENNPERTAKLYHRAMLYVFLLLLPAVIAIVLFGKTGLEVWLNTEFAANSFHVAQILAIGVFLHSFAMCSATLIQGVGRPSLTAKLQLFQLPFYLGVLWWLTTSYGVIGAASSWTLRAGVTLLAMAYMAEKFVLVPKTSTEEGPA
jgi:O-antigen/teichoic acid export membrane protein